MSGAVLNPISSAPNKAATMQSNPKTKQHFTYDESRKII
jgi:hypothetical protein